MDAYGGDNAPGCVVDGMKSALAEFDDVEFILCGDEQEFKQYAGDRVSIVHAPDRIAMSEAPVMAVRKKTDSSLVKAMLEVKEGRADAVVSAGSTGAVLAGGMFRIGRVKGIERPALAPVLPGQKGPVMFVDVGANVDCKPVYLNQFAMMGTVYMESVVGIRDASAGLANIGEEEEKGNWLCKEAYQLMKNQHAYRFAGNIEARDFMVGDIPVVVFDGFVGNIALKFSEGFAKIMLSEMKQAMLVNLRSKIGALLLKPALMGFRKKMDYREYGGAPLLGVEGAVIKAHGSSDARAYYSSIKVARNMLLNDVTGKIKSGLEKLGSDD